MKNLLKKDRPTLLVEYNKSNFNKINNFLKKHYDCYFYNFKSNKLIKLSRPEIYKLKQGRILEKKFKKNSVNIFFIKKNYYSGV